MAKKKRSEQKTTIFNIAENRGLTIRPVSRIPTGIKPLDVLLSGGIVRGAVIEVAGPTAVGKSSIALQIAASAMSFEPGQEKKVLFIPTESGFDLNYAASFGLKAYNPTDKTGNPKCHIIGAQTIENCWEIIRCVGSDYQQIIIDSIAALISDKELEEGEHLGQLHIRSQKLTAFLNFVDKIATRNNIAVIMTNQQRSKGNYLGGFSEGYSGPRAQRHLIAQSLELKPKHKQSEAERNPHTGESVKHFKFNTVTVTITKNKFGPIGNSVNLCIKNSGGYDNIQTLLYYAKERNLIRETTVGKTLDIKGGVLFTNLPELYDKVSQNPDLVKALEARMPYANHDLIDF